jgi:hypothetical protein
VKKWAEDFFASKSEIKIMKRVGAICPDEGEVFAYAVARC